jgi:hypothetical protein
VEGEVRSPSARGICRAVSPILVLLLSCRTDPLHGEAGELSFPHLRQREFGAIGNVNAKNQVDKAKKNLDPDKREMRRGGKSVEFNRESGR